MLLVAIQLPKCVVLDFGILSLGSKIVDPHRGGLNLFLDLVAISNSVPADKLKPCQCLEQMYVHIQRVYVTVLFLHNYSGAVFIY